MIDTQLCVSEQLKMSMRALMAFGSECLRCKLDIRSGHMEDVFASADGCNTIRAGENEGWLGYVCPGVSKAVVRWM